jgi:glycosyltransferase involved in cell wall biosynthesis
MSRTTMDDFSVRIVAVNNRFPPDSWLGPETQIFYRLRWLQAKGWKTSVVTLGKTNSSKRNVFQGIEIHYIRSFENRYGKKNQNLATIMRWAKEDIFDPMTFLKCIHIFGRERPNLVWVRCLDQLSLAPLFSAKLMGIPVVITPADFWWLCHIGDPLTTCLGLDGRSCASCICEEGYLGLKSKNTIQTSFLNEVLYILRRVKERIFNSAFDLVIFPSEFLKNHYTREMRRVPKNTLIYNPGIIDVIPDSSEDIRAKLNLSNEPIILYVGTLRFGKAADVLVEAFDDIKREIPDSKLFIVGDGPERSSLMSLAQRSEFREDIVFTGLISDRRKLSAYYKISDVVVAPSRYYYPPSYSAVVLEALAHGKPVVVTEKGDESVLRDGVNGYKVSLSPRDLASGVIKVLKDHETNFSENNRSLYEKNFSHSAIFKEYFEIFNSIAENAEKAS